MEDGMNARLFGRTMALQAFWSFDRMQSLGLLFGLDPVLRRAHDEPMDYREAALRHMGFFNTNPYMAGFVVGAVARMEEDLSRLPRAGRVALAGRIENAKRGLGASLAAVGDTLFWGTLRPACAAVAALAGLLAWRAAGPAAAAGVACALYLASFNAAALWTRWEGLRAGREHGDELVQHLASMRWQQKTRWAARAGLAACALACALALTQAPWGAGALAACAALRTRLSAPLAYAALAVVCAAAAGAA